MKVISKDRLKNILELLGYEFITERTMEKIFKEYGDEYYINRNNGQFECCKKNTQLESDLKNSKTRIK